MAVLDFAHGFHHRDCPKAGESSIQSLGASGRAMKVLRLMREEVLYLRMTLNFGAFSRAMRLWECCDRCREVLHFRTVFPWLSFDDPDLAQPNFCHWHLLPRLRLSLLGWRWLLICWCGSPLWRPPPPNTHTHTPRVCCNHWIKIL